MLSLLETAAALAPEAEFAVEPPPSGRGSALERQIACSVEMALFHTPSPPTSERRRETRHPYPNPVWITPLSDSGEPLDAETFVVLGRHISSQGLDCFSREPIAHRRVITSFPSGENGWTALLLEISWRRFTRFGWYENGGRFLEAVYPPLAERRDF